MTQCCACASAHRQMSLRDLHSRRDSGSTLRNIQCRGNRSTPALMDPLLGGNGRSLGPVPLALYGHSGSSARRAEICCSWCGLSRGRATGTCTRCGRHARKARLCYMRGRLWTCGLVQDEEMLEEDLERLFGSQACRRLGKMLRVASSLRNAKA